VNAVDPTASVPNWTGAVVISGMFGNTVPWITELAARNPIASGSPCARVPASSSSG
jgi:hypothetical protein